MAEHEAEDVIASLCALVDGTVEIASGDRDLFALVEGQRVRILYPEKSGLSVIDEDEVARRYGIPGRRYADFAILRGDPSDGLPGLKGVGNVAAAAMVRRYGDIAGVLRERQLRDGDREYLESALAVLCDRFADRSGLEISCRVRADVLPSLSRDVELVIYRVAQEALTNVARHSGDAAAELTLEPVDGSVVLAVRDSGRGLDADRSDGSGIRGMRERAGLVGATLELRNRDPGPGAEVLLRVPIAVAA